jgi:hypothetical protein
LPLFVQSGNDERSFSISRVRVEAAADPWVVVHIDVAEYLAFNNSLNWACNGTDALEGDQFQKHLGASEDDVQSLLRFIHDAGGGPGTTLESLALTKDQVAILSRVLDVMVEGPADCLNDYELIRIDGSRFDEIRQDLHEASAQLAAK